MEAESENSNLGVGEKENESSNDTEFLSACDLLKKILSGSGIENSVNAEATANKNPENNILSLDDFIQSFQDSDEETNSEIVTTFHVKGNETNTKKDENLLSSVAEESENNVFNESSQEDQKDVSISDREDENSATHVEIQKLGNREKCKTSHIQKLVNNYSDDNEVHHNSLNVSKDQEGVNTLDKEVDSSTVSVGTEKVENRALCYASNGSDVQEFLSSSFNGNELHHSSLNVSEGSFTCKVCNFKTSISELYKIHVQNHTSESSGSCSDMKGLDKETKKSLDNTTNTVNLSKSETCSVCNRGISKSLDENYIVETIADKHCVCDVNKRILDLNKCSGKELRIQLYDVKHVDHELYNGVLNRTKWNSEKSDEANHAEDCNLSAGVENDVGNVVNEHSHIDTLFLSTPVECMINNNVETTFKATSSIKNINSEEKAVEEKTGIYDVFVDENNDDGTEEFCGFGEILPPESTSDTVSIEKFEKNSFICKKKRNGSSNKLCIFNCSKCSYTSKWKHNLKVHMEKKHSKETFYQCKNCKYYKSTSKQLEKHKISCGKSLNIVSDPTVLAPNQNVIETNKYESSLKVIESVPNIPQSKEENKATVICNRKDFMKSKRNLNKLYYCSVCSYVSEYSANVKIHMKRRHPTEKCESLSKILQSKEENYKTSVCDIKNSTISQKSLTRLFYCYQCSYTSRLNGNLKLHMKRRHSVKHFYQCRKCKRYKHTLNQLREHEAKCNNYLSPKETNVSPLLQNGNVNKANHFKCKVSSLPESSKKENASQPETFQTKSNSLVFSNKQMEDNINEDSLSNNEESSKKFRCSFCTYSSNNLYLTKQHVLTHTDLRLYKCKYCDFKSNLKKSIRNHYLRYHISNIINNSSEEDQGDVESVLSELCKVDLGAFNISSLYISVRKCKDKASSIGSPTAKEETMVNHKDKEFDQSLSTISVVNEDFLSKKHGSQNTFSKKRKSNIKFETRKGIFENEENCSESIASSQIREYLNDNITKKSVYSCDNPKSGKVRKKQKVNCLSHFTHELKLLNTSASNNQVIENGVQENVVEHRAVNSTSNLTEQVDNGEYEKTVVNHSKKYPSENLQELHSTKVYEYNDQVINLGMKNHLGESGYGRNNHAIEKDEEDKFVKKKKNVNRNFSYSYILSKYLEDLGPIDPIKCETCNFTAKSVSVFKRHICKSKDCNEVEMDSTGETRHTHVEKRLKCGKCKYSTNSKLTYSRHKCKSRSINKLVQNDLTTKNEQNHDLTQTDDHLVKFTESHNHINEVEKSMKNAEAENKLKFKKRKHTSKSKNSFTRDYCKSSHLSESEKTDGHHSKFTESHNHKNDVEERIQNVEAGKWLKCEKCEHTMKSKRFFSSHKCKSESVNKLIHNQSSLESKNQGYNQTDDYPVKFTQSHNHMNDISLKIKDPKDRELKAKCREFAPLSETDLKTHNCKLEFTSVNNVQELDSEKTYNCDHCEFITTSVFILNSHNCNSNSSDHFQNNNLNDVKKLEVDKSVECDNPESTNKPVNIFKKYTCRAKPFKCKYCDYATNKIILLMEHSGIIHSNDDSLRVSDEKHSEMESSDHQINITQKLERDTGDLKSQNDFYVKKLRKRSTIKSPQKLRDSVYVTKQDSKRSSCDEPDLQIPNFEKSPLKNNTSNSETLDVKSPLKNNTSNSETLDEKSPLKNNTSNSETLDVKSPLKNNTSNSETLDEKSPLKNNTSNSETLEEESKVLKCPFCQYVSYNGNYLKRHLKRVHFKFDLCRPKKEKLSLKKNRRAKLIKLSNQSKKSATFSCRYCDFTSYFKLNYKRHVRNMHVQNQSRIKKEGFKRKVNNSIQNNDCPSAKGNDCLSAKESESECIVRVKGNRDAKRILRDLSKRKNNNFQENKFTPLCKPVMSTLNNSDSVEDSRRVLRKNTKNEMTLHSKKNLIHNRHCSNKETLLRSNLEKKAFKCSKCIFESYFLKSMNRHMKTHSDKETPLFKCANCSFKSVNRGNYERHKRICNDVHATKISTSESEKKCDRKNTEEKIEISAGKVTDLGSSKDISKKKTDSSGNTILSLSSLENKGIEKKMKLIGGKNPNETSPKEKKDKQTSFKGGSCSFKSNNRVKCEKHKNICKDDPTIKVSTSEKECNIKNIDIKTEPSPKNKDNEKTVSSWSKFTNINYQREKNVKTETSKNEVETNKSLESKITDHSSSKEKSKKKTNSSGNKINSRSSLESKGLTKKTKSFRGKNLNDDSSKGKKYKKSLSQKKKTKSNIKGRPSKFDISQIIKSNKSVRIYDCLDCKYKTIYRSALTYHMTSQRHKGNLHHCNLCKFKIHNKSMLIRHRSKKHTNSKHKVLRCPSCDFVTSWKGALKTHENHFHS